VAGRSRSRQAAPPQLTLPASNAAKIETRQIGFQQSARRTQLAPLRRGAFTKRGLELTVASSFMRISIDDYLLKPAPT
jgi:hypothetical protein